MIQPGANLNRCVNEMATLSEYRAPDAVANPDRPAPCLQAALEARERFLARRPDLRPFQEEIDRLINGAGDADNRMAVLEFLMESHLIRLKQSLTALAGLLEKNRQEAAAPDGKEQGP